MHGGALVRAQEGKKRFNEKVNLKRHSMLHLREHVRFHFKKHLKIHKNMKKKMHFTLQLVIHLTVQSRGALEGIFNGSPKDAPRMSGACEVALKGATEVALEFHLWLHLLMQ